MAVVMLQIKMCLIESRITTATLKSKRPLIRTVVRPWQADIIQKDLRILTSHCGDGLAKRYRCSRLTTCFCLDLFAL